MQIAMQNIKLSVKRTQSLLVLSNRGIEWMGEDQAALSQLLAARSPSLPKLRVLLLSEDAPWLKRWATERNRSEAFLREEISNVHKRIEIFIRGHLQLDPQGIVRYHEENPTWRLLITDDRAFVASYATSDQAREAAVFEFEGPSSEMYQAYLRYFDYVWSRSGTNRDAVEQESKTSDPFDSLEVSAGAVVCARENGINLILLLERQDGSITLPKGHIEVDEDPQVAAFRELAEKTGLPADDLAVETDLGWYRNPVTLDGTKVFKVVRYFLMRYEGNYLPKLTASTSHRSVGWYRQEQLTELKFAYAHVEELVKLAVGTRHP
jgi:8-oxo-dGTP pyrophosphatase MutT (NUDIX family)